MEEPSLTTSRRVLAGATAIALVLGGGGFLLGRATMPAAESSTASDDPVEIIVPSPALTWSGPLARPDLIAFAALAADTAASGMAPDEELVRSEGRRFVIRLPFGCDGPSLAGTDTGTGTGWTFDSSSGTLRVSVVPQQWAAEEWFETDPSTENIETVEGLWIERPWTSSEACPAAPEPPPAAADEDAVDAEEAESPAAPAAPPPAPVRTLAIGQVYTTESPRAGRRGGEPFAAVARIAASELDVSQGFRLRISGRLAKAAGAAPAVCRQADSATRPVCLLTVTMDEVAIENPATGVTLATWTLAQRSPAGAN